MLKELRHSLSSVVKTFNLPRLQGWKNVLMSAVVLIVAEFSTRHTVEFNVRGTINLYYIVKITSLYYYLVFTKPSLGLSHEILGRFWVNLVY